MIIFLAYVLVGVLTYLYSLNVGMAVRSYWEHAVLCVLLWPALWVVAVLQRHQ